MDETFSEKRVQEARPKHRTLSTSFRCAFAGFWYALKTQRNMRIHLAIALVVLALGLYLDLGWNEWALLTLTSGFVLAAEMFNTVAEAAMDAATPHYHPLVKTAKDVAAGVVLLTATASIIVGLLILGPPLWARIAVLLGS